MDITPRQKEPEDPRVRFAGERTLLAWIRTGLAMMGFGFVVARFGMFLREIAASEHARPPAPVGMSLWIGIALVTLGVVINLLAGLQHYFFVARLDRGETFKASRWPLAVIVSALVAAMGVAMTAYLIVAGY